MVTDTELLSDIAEVGIIFLLFLLGLDMQPSHLYHMLKKATLVAVLSSMVFAAIGYGTGKLFGYTETECIIIGVSLMFSSTIIGIKLLPTTVLHHKHTGELVVGLLLLQDVIAIIALLAIDSSSSGEVNPTTYIKTLLAFPLLIGSGWCLGLAEAAQAMGLSAEIGAFIAGVSLATSPIALYIADSLKPLRDFFLILFFFSIGASFNLTLLDDVILPALLLAVLVISLKPVTFKLLLQKISESNQMSWEVGFRLGQTSEFSLLIAYLATSTLLIGQEASHLIQATAILTFLISSYIVIFNFPSPIAVSDRLRRD